MTNVTLFDAAQAVRESVNKVDPETGEIVESYTESRELFQNKAVACVAYAKEEAATLASAKAMIKEMLSKVEAREKRLERFEAYLADCMKATGITEVMHDLGLFGAKLYLDRDESVELEPDAEFPASLCNDPKPPTPSKTKIKAAIKAGEAVDGARIVRKDRLTITHPPTPHQATRRGGFFFGANMTKTAVYKPIDPAELSISNDPYTGRERTEEGKYAEIFRRAKQGQRIVCPEGRAGGIAHAYAKWLKKNVGAKQPIVRTKDRCDDGKGGVWWLGEKEAKTASTVWAPLKKAA